MDERGAGWVLFAGIVLIWGGIMKIFDANWAFRYHGVVPSNLEAGILGHSLKTYAWVDLGVAVNLLICGVLVIKGSRLPMGGHHRCRRRWSQRHLVDAVLPGLGVRLHRDRRFGRLCLGRLWR